VLLGIVEHVTPLGECCEIVGAVVGGIVVQMGAGQDHTRDRKSWGREVA
jgi:hypothetical protein